MNLEIHEQFIELKKELGKLLDRIGFDKLLKRKKILEDQISRSTLTILAVTMNFPITKSTICIGMIRMNL